MVATFPSLITTELLEDSEIASDLQWLFGVMKSVGTISEIEEFVCRYPMLVDKRATEKLLENVTNLFQEMHAVSPTPKKKSSLEINPAKLIYNNPSFIFSFER